MIFFIKKGWVMNNIINETHKNYIYIKKRTKNTMKTLTLTPHICPLCIASSSISSLITINNNVLLLRSLTPHCRWYQRECFVFLTVEVMDCQDPDISVMDNKLFFTCTGADMKKYELDLELLRDINTKVG